MRSVLTVTATLQVSMHMEEFVDDASRQDKPK